MYNQRLELLSMLHLHHLCDHQQMCRCIYVWHFHRCAKSEVISSECDAYFCHTAMWNSELPKQYYVFLSPAVSSAAVFSLCGKRYMAWNV